MYAYEGVLNRKKFDERLGPYEWQMTSRHGIMKAVERVVNRPDDATGFTALMNTRMEDLPQLSFGTLAYSVLRLLSERARTRLQKWKAG